MSPALKRRPTELASRCLRWRAYERRRYFQILLLLACFACLAVWACTPKSRRLEGNRDAAEEVVARREPSAPGNDGGLLLYAHSLAELHAYRPDGPILGRVHPGALVTVVHASDGPSVRIAGLPFRLYPPDLEVFVDRGALGIEPRETQPYRPPGRIWSVRIPYVIGWLDAQPTASWWSVDCEDSWVLEDFRVAQYVRGIELVGKSEHFAPATRAWAVSSQEALRCPAHAVTMGAAIPAGFQSAERPAPDPLRTAVEHNGMVHWLLQTESGTECDTWRFSSTKGPPGASGAGEWSGRLTRQRLVDVAGQNKRASHPFRFRPATAEQPAQLLLDTLRLDGDQAFKCECDYRYALLRAKDGELTMMGRPLPERVAAFDPADAERWFLSHEKCEQARRGVVQRIEADGTSASNLGLHAVVGSFGL